jgi:D-alanyl-D-alanine carboxypeptidase/D-alanyl-D-alanine-endopeptidase (penicillin-binding protein 4)
VIIDASLLSRLSPTQTESAIELAAIDSPPITELVRVINKFSHNLYAEALLRVMGRVLNPSVRESDEAGIEIIKTVLQDAGIELTPLEIHDGSGLSRRTLVTAAATAKLLNYMQQQPTYQAFQTSLPVAGVDGSLTQRMAGSVAANNVQAKTGTLTHTSALAGYVHTAAGEPLIFSIIINHFTGELRQARALENEICILLAGLSQKLQKEKEGR